MTSRRLADFAMGALIVIGGGATMLAAMAMAILLVYG